MPRRPEQQLAGLQAELDPDGSFGTRKIWAACKSTGIEPEDLDSDFMNTGPELHPKVPKERTEDIQRQRHDIRSGLRESRMQQVREAMEALNEDDVRRYERVAVRGPSGGGSGPGVRPLQPGDIPPAEAIDGIAESKAEQQRQLERVQKDQERKANAICTDFLMGKKRADEADAKVYALNKRLRDYKIAKDAENKARSLELQKAQEKRQSNAARAAKERAEYEDELERKCADRLANARARRAHHFSTENLSEKTESANAKREAAYQSALELEEQTLADLMHRQAETEERLYYRNQEVAQMLEQRRQDAQEKFLQKQVAVEAMKQEWAENKLRDHNDYMTRFKDSRKRGDDFMKDRSKSTGDIHKKATDKWKSNHDRLMNEKDTRNEEILKRHADAAYRIDYEHKPMKWKCGGDVFSHVEVKEKTFGDLQKRRYAELQKAQDARTLASCIKIAERAAKDDAQKAMQAEVAKKRVEAKKEILRYSNEASAVFLKIKSEPNEGKIRQAMKGLGFKMPKIPGDEEEDA